MVLLKSALSSILVVLGACDRAAVDRPPAPSEAAATAPVAVAVHPGASPVRQAVVKPPAGPARDAAKTVYVCPMHPEVVSETPALCPKCNMKLDPKPQATEERHAEERQDSPSWP